MGWECPDSILEGSDTVWEMTDGVWDFSDADWGRTCACWDYPQTAWETNDIAWATSYDGCFSLGTGLGETDLAGIGMDEYGVEIEIKGGCRRFPEHRLIFRQVRLGCHLLSPSSPISSTHTLSLSPPKSLHSSALNLPRKSHPSCNIAPKRKPSASAR